MAITLKQITMSLCKKDIKNKLDEKHETVVFVLSNKEMTIVNIVKLYNDNTILEWNKKFLNIPNGEGGIDKYLTDEYALHNHISRYLILDETLRWDSQKKHGVETYKIRYLEMSINFSINVPYNDTETYNFDDALNTTLHSTRDEVEEEMEFFTSLVAKHKNQAS